MRRRRMADYTVTEEEAKLGRGTCLVKLPTSGGGWRYCRNAAPAGSFFCVVHGGRAATKRTPVGVEQPR